MKSVPHRCEQCVEEGSYTGHLVFENMQQPPTCRSHKIPVTPVVRKVEPEVAPGGVKRIA